MKYLCSFILLFSALAGRAQTMLGGIISRDTTWTAANSPYLVVDDVVVDVNVRLTIEPGVTLFFKLGKQLLVQYGTLIAKGTERDSIYFRSQDTASKWSGIHLVQPADPVSLAYCHISYADKALTLATTTTPATLTIRKSRFSDNNLALEFFDSSSTISMDSTDFDQNNYAIQNNYKLKTFGMSDCRFRYNYKAIIDLRQSLSSPKAQITNCLFYKNEIGIQLPSNMSFRNCSFISNSSAIDGAAGYCSYTDCRIDSNSLRGIYAGYDSVVNCHFRANTGNCIDADKGNYIAKNIFEDNETCINMNGGNHDAVIAENLMRRNRSGVSPLRSGALFTRNILEDNWRGLLVYIDTARTAVIKCNKFCGDTVAVLLTDDRPPYATVDLTNNYWCTTDSATIAGYITDKNDWPNLPKSVFIPFDISECYKPVSVPELPNDPVAIKVYPNPAGDFITVAGIHATAMLDIYAMDGKKVHHQSGNQQVSVSGFVPGFYLIRISTPDGFSTVARFVKL